MPRYRPPPIPQQPIKAKSRRGIIDAVKRIMREIVTAPNHPDVKKLRQALGDALLDIVKAEYLRKGQGRTDDAGIKWEPTKKWLAGESPEGMGIDTGDLFESFDVVATQDGIKITVDPDYARFFLAKRPAWPDNNQLPVRWINRALLEIAPSVLSYVHTRLRTEARRR